MKLKIVIIKLATEISLHSGIIIRKLKNIFSCGNVLKNRS